MVYICVSKLTIIGSDNCLSPGRHQVIIWTNTGILLIEPLGTGFNEILIVCFNFSSPQCVNILRFEFTLHHPQESIEQSFPSTNFVYIFNQIPDKSFHGPNKLEASIGSNNFLNQWWPYYVTRIYFTWSQWGYGRVGVVIVRVEWKKMQIMLVLWLQTDHGMSIAVYRLSSGNALYDNFVSTLLNG